MLLFIKLFFRRRTNKGGRNSGAGETESKKSRLIPNGKILQRRFFLICNLMPDTIWRNDFNIDQNFSFEDDVIFDRDLLQQV